MAGQQKPEEPLPSLSPAEWEVMKTFWDHGAMAARDCHSQLGEHRGWAMNTVKTLLARLVGKGALDYVQVGNSYLYKPSVERDRMMMHEVEDFHERVVGANPAGSVAVHFLRSSQLTPDDIARLRKLLDEKEGQLHRRKEERS